MATSLLRQAAISQSLDQDLVQALSNRELRVFEMIGEGLNAQDIARRLGISPTTVESYRKVIIDAFTELLARCGYACPRWPIWGESGIFRRRTTVWWPTLGVDELLRRAGSRVGAFCWDFRDNRITACRTIRPEEGSPADWFPWLGLERPGDRTAGLL